MKFTNQLTLMGGALCVFQMAILPCTAQDPCANGDLNERSARYNTTTLAVVVKQFNDHFRVDADSIQMDGIADTINVASLHKEMKILTDNGRDPAAIRVRYGLKDTNFVAVMQFMELDITRSFADPIGPYYLAAKGVLGPISEQDAEGYMISYATRVLIRRTGGGGWDKIELGGDFPDPRTEWFMLDLKLNRLMSENPTGNQLVLKCISEPVCYSALSALKSNKAVGEGQEFRHMIAWYMMENNTPLLDTTSLSKNDPGKIYVKRAVDLGHLCPPRCK